MKIINTKEYACCISLIKKINDSAKLQVSGEYMYYINNLVRSLLVSIKNNFVMDDIETQEQKKKLEIYKSAMLKYVSLKFHKNVEIHSYDLTKEYLYLLLQDLPFGNSVDPNNLKNGSKKKLIKFRGDFYKASPFMKKIAEEILTFVDKDPYHKYFAKSLYTRIVGTFGFNPGKKTLRYVSYSSYITNVGIVCSCRNHLLKTFQKYGIMKNDILECNTDGFTICKEIPLKIGTAPGDGKHELITKNGCFLAKCCGFGAIWENNKQIKFQRTSLYMDDYEKNGLHLTPFEYSGKDLTRDFANFDYHMENVDKKIGEIQIHDITKITSLQEIVDMLDETFKWEIID